MAHGKVFVHDESDGLSSRFCFLLFLPMYGIVCYSLSNVRVKSQIVEGFCSLFHKDWEPLKSYC